MSDRKPGYEKGDINTRGVWIFAAGLTVSVALVIAAIGGMMRYLASHPPSPDTVGRSAAPGVIPPPPVLQTSPRADMDAYRAAQSAILSTYGWVDREADLIRIPVDRAMTLLVERGVPPGTPATPLEMRQQRAAEP